MENNTPKTKKGDKMKQQAVLVEEALRLSGETNLTAYKIAVLIKAGKSSREIAAELQCKPDSVRAWLAAVYRKLGHDRQVARREAIVAAEGWLAGTLSTNEVQSALGEHWIRRLRGVSSAFPDGVLSQKIKSALHRIDGGRDKLIALWKAGERDVKKLAVQTGYSEGSIHNTVYRARLAGEIT